MLPLELVGVCRLCLLKEQVDISIFENGSKETYYKISTCLPITISSEDELPKKICLNCYNKVNIFYDFWNQTLETEKHLLSWLNAETDTFNNFDKQSQPFSYSGITENLDDDDNIHNHNIDGDSDENHNDSDVENDIKKSMNERNFDEYDEFNVPKNNHILSVDYQDEKPGPSGFQEEQSSALKQLQGYTDELTHNSLSNLSKIFQVLNSPEDMTENTLPSPINDKHPNSADVSETDSPYRCESCDKSFSCEDILAMHKITQCNDPSEEKKCYLCDETFSTPIELSQHMKNIHDDRKFQCEECGKCFLTKHHLRMHSSMHLDSKPFSCQKCGTNFRYKKTYETHVKIHANEKKSTDEQTFICDICEQRFSTRNSYIHHARSHKNVTSKCKLMCFVCNQTFASKRMLTQHLRMQCGEKTYACDTCGKELLTKESLECHKLIHVDEKSLVCKTCGKTFSHRKYFVVHQRIHTGERPYKCVTCNKTFTQASTLTVHRRYHTGERPYKCFVCSKGFVTRTIMLSHLKYHKES